jgi:uncharacterized protein YjiS (DUF1127 family)
MNTSLFGYRLVRNDLNAYRAAAIVTKPIKRVISWLASERRVHSDIARLAALNDYTLADIGLGRGEIEYLARYGRPARRGCTE